MVLTANNKLNNRSRICGENRGQPTVPSGNGGEGGKHEQAVSSWICHNGTFRYENATLFNTGR